MHALVVMWKWSRSSWLPVKSGLRELASCTTFWANLVISDLLSIDVYVFKMTCLCQDQALIVLNALLVVVICNLISWSELFKDSDWLHSIAEALNSYPIPLVSVMLFIVVKHVNHEDFISQFAEVVTDFCNLCSLEHKRIFVRLKVVVMTIWHITANKMTLLSHSIIIYFYFYSSHAEKRQPSLVIAGFN